MIHCRKMLKNIQIYLIICNKITISNHSNDVIEQWMTTKNIALCRINANNQSAGMNIHHGKDAHKKH